MGGAAADESLVGTKPGLEPGGFGAAIRSGEELGGLAAV